MAIHHGERTLAARDLVDQLLGLDGLGHGLDDEARGLLLRQPPQGVREGRALAHMDGAAGELLRLAGKSLRATAADHELAHHGEGTGEGDLLGAGRRHRQVRGDEISPALAQHGDELIEARCLNELDGEPLLLGEALQQGAILSLGHTLPGQEVLLGALDQHAQGAALDDDRQISGRLGRLGRRRNRLSGRRLRSLGEDGILGLWLGRGGHGSGRRGRRRGRLAPLTAQKQRQHDGEQPSGGGCVEPNGRHQDTPPR